MIINSLSKPINYQLQLQGPKDFKIKLENVAKVEETLINNDIIKLTKDCKGFSNNSSQSHNLSNRLSDKNKSWWRNNNKHITNEWVVKANHVKPKLPPSPNQKYLAINNTNMTARQDTPKQDQARPFYRRNTNTPLNQNISSQQVAYNQAPPLKGYKYIDQLRVYTPIGETYERELQTLLEVELIILPKAKPYQPQVKPKCWSEKQICAYHCNQGHITNNCYALNGSIQKLIDNGTIEVKILCNNEDHRIFKNPFMSHDKGQSSKKK